MDSDDKEVKDFSYSRFSNFYEICNKDSVASSITQGMDSIDKIFGNEAVRCAYRAFRKFDVVESSESSILSIPFLESNMTTVIFQLLKSWKWNQHQV